MVSHFSTPADPAAHLRSACPDHPVVFFRPDALAAAARRFRAEFPGLVTYAVKANPSEAVLRGLVSAGIDTFDVASPAEMAAVRAVLPEARLHYHNPVRSADEIAAAHRFGIASWSIDRAAELDKLRQLPEGSEIAVRLRLPVRGAAYDFGAKFGADPDAAVALLKTAAARGFTPSMTFHPGTQCPEPSSWVRYIEAAAEIAARAGTPLARLNVGGGFAADRDGRAADLSAVFAAIGEATARAFGATAPALVCEPGRAMVAEALSVALRVKAADEAAVTLNDGVYGLLGEWRDLGAGARLRVVAPDGTRRSAPARPRTVFGPTCDSVDVLPGAVPLPDDLADGDYLLIDGMGAYSTALVTGFNGYGRYETVTLAAPVV